MLTFGTEVNYLMFSGLIQFHFSRGRNYWILAHNPMTVLSSITPLEHMVITITLKILDTNHW